MGICQFTISLGPTRGDGSSCIQALRDCILRPVFSPCVHVSVSAQQRGAREGREWYTREAASIMTWPSSQGEPWSGHLFDRKEWGKSISVVPSWTDDRQLQWQELSPQGPTPSHPPHWWLRQRERERKIVGDGANEAHKPQGYFRGRDLCTPPHFMWRRREDRVSVRAKDRVNGVIIMVFTFSVTLVFYFHVKLTF